MSHGRSGIALVTVLIVTGIGLLFGAGALLLFRYQCQLRVDRQHEMEKVYAVRSALNYIRTFDGEINNEYEPFNYHTQSDRGLNLLIKPVDPVFPVLTNPLHLDIGNEGNNNRVFALPCGHPECITNYCERLDYEYGAIGTTNLLGSIMNRRIQVVQQGKQKRTITTFGLQFDDLTATNNVEWWVNIGMRDTEGWLKTSYGRRYFFWPREYVNGSNDKGIKDVIRLCIIRNVTNKNEKVGCRHGWPLAHTAYTMDNEYIGERALVFQVSPKKDEVTGGLEKTSVATVSELWYTGSSVEENRLIVEDSWPDNGYMGVQIANDKVTMFYIGMEGNGGAANGYHFSKSASMTIDTFKYFKDRIQIGNEYYPGTNIINGRVQAPELRAVIDVVAMSNLRSGSDFLNNFRVTPAYQYDVSVVRPELAYRDPRTGLLCYDLVTNLATVAQKIGEYDREGTLYTTLTYDTHGTENKGFRKDEREAARRQQGR